MGPLTTLSSQVISIGVLDHLNQWFALLLPIAIINVCKNFMRLSLQLTVAVKCTASSSIIIFAHFRACLVKMYRNIRCFSVA